LKALTFCPSESIQRRGIVKHATKEKDMYLKKAVKADLTEQLESIIKLSELVQESQKTSEKFDSAYQRCKAIRTTAKYVVQVLNYQG